MGLILVGGSSITGLLIYIVSEIQSFVGNSVIWGSLEGLEWLNGYLNRVGSREKGRFWAEKWGKWGLEADFGLKKWLKGVKYDFWRSKIGQKGGFLAKNALKRVKIGSKTPKNGCFLLKKGSKSA